MLFKAARRPCRVSLIHHIRDTLADELSPSRSHALGEGDCVRALPVGPHAAGVVPMHRIESAEPAGASAALPNEVARSVDTYTEVVGVRADG